MKHILGIDPGLETGWVWVDVPEDAPAVVTAQGEDKVDWPFCVGEELEWWAESTSGTDRLVIIESWVPMDVEFGPDPNFACQPIGIVVWLCKLYNIPLVAQIPKLRHGVTDEILRASGYWLVGGRGHKRQALRHVLAYLQQPEHRHMPTVLKLHPRPDEAL